ncbi:MAG: HAD-IA family hydrolase [Rhizobiales bacterium]|nr:HAD-IA family hydrolase [Hyphomicrobiales bacterium]
MQPKLVIFDLDGTLVDGAHSVVDAMQFAFVSNKYPKPTNRQIMDIIGLSLPQAIIKIISNFNELSDISDSYSQDIEQSYKDYFFKARISKKNASPIYEGALEAIDKLHVKDELLLGIATGKSRRGVDAFLDEFNLSDKFFTTYCSTECISKPNPDMILRAIKDAGVDKQNTVMIGDTSYDMEMAKSAGIHAIGVNWGYHSQNIMLSAGADIIVENFDQLTKHIFEYLDIK